MSELQIGKQVEFIGQNPQILKGETGEIIALQNNAAKVRFNLKNKVFTWESWFLIDTLKKME